jgi:precorrin-3B methylase
MEDNSFPLDMKYAETLDKLLPREGFRKVSSVLNPAGVEIRVYEKGNEVAVVSVSGDSSIYVTKGVALDFTKKEELK